MTETLYIVHGDHAPAELPRSGKLIVGSSPDRAGFVVDAEGVEQVHCAIGRLKSGGFALKDLGAPGGTFLNGERVDTARLSEGDVIGCGGAELRIQSSGAMARSAARGPSAAAAPMPREERSGGERRAAASSRVPAELGGYRIQRLLGRGAMGDVYLATQTSLDREVALKVLKARLAGDAKFVERFRTEARAAARLNHPHIVTAYDVGEDAGHHFLSMEFMGGGSIEAQLKTRGRLPANEVIAILRDAARGLVYAESKGIVHRDIKPENLMRGDGGTVKIADLGLAVQVEQDAVEGETGKVYGTPHFIAPEVLRGQQPDTRADLFALGVTAYRLLSGRTPFDGADARAIARSILSDEPPRLGDVVSGVPADLERLVHRLLQKEPEARPGSAAEALTMLEGAGAAKGRGKGLLIAVGALALLGGGAGLFLAGGGGEDPPADPDAVASAGGTTDVDAAGSGAKGPGTTIDPASGGGVDGGVEAGGPGPDSAPDPADDGGAARAFEERAREALLALEGEELTDDARLKRLREIESTFAGTDTATEARAAADAMEAAAAEARASREARLEARRAAVDELRGRLDAAATGPLVARLAPLIEFVAPPELADDPELADLLSSRASEAVSASLAEARTALEQADGARASGDIEATAGALQDVVDLATLPPEEDRARIPGVSALGETLGALDALRDEARTRLADIGDRATEFTKRRIRAERAAAARVLGEGLRDDLAALELEAAAIRVGKAAEAVTGARITASYRAVAEDLRAAQGALDALFEGWTGEGWRRPVIRRPGTEIRADVVGIAPPRVLLVEAEGGGKPERLPLADFVTDAAAMCDLLQPKRLHREWTAEEARGVARCLAMTAALEGLAQVRPFLSRDRVRFTEAEAEAALAPFDALERWKSEDEGALALIADERRAFTALLAALRARSDGFVGESAALLGRLLREDRASFTVMLLSDGGRR